MPRITRKAKTATVETETAPLFRVTADDTAPATTEAAPATRVGLLLWVRAGDLVVATASSPHADLYEAPRTTDEEDAALAAEIKSDGRVTKSIEAHDRGGVLVVCDGRRRTRAAQEALGDDALVPVLVTPERPEHERRLAAHAANATSCPPCPAALARDLVAARDAGVVHARLVSASGGVESRTRALLVIGERASTRLLDWVAARTIGETAALRIIESAPARAVQDAALDLLNDEIDHASAHGGRSSRLTGSQKPDVTVTDGVVRVSVSACEVAAERAAQSAGHTTKRAKAAAKKAAKAEPVPVPVPVAEVAKVEPVEPVEVKPAKPTVAEIRADVEAGRQVSLADLSAAIRAEAKTTSEVKTAPVAPTAPPTTVTAAATAALSRALTVDASGMTDPQRQYLAGMRAALALLVHGQRPGGGAAAQYGAAFDAVFPA